MNKPVQSRCLWGRGLCAALHQSPSTAGTGRGQPAFLLRCRRRTRPPQRERGDPRDHPEPEQGDPRELPGPSRSRGTPGTEQGRGDPRDHPGLSRSTGTPRSSRG